MTDRDALYAAILAHPDEDTPRLLYADWLEENGQAQAAKYVRAACELARLDEDDPSLAAFPTEAPAFWSDIEPDVAHRQALAAVGLPRDHESTELARFPKLDGVHTHKIVLTAETISPFSRGFVERATFDTVADFVRHADIVFRAVPIRELVIRAPDPEGLKQVASSRWFPQIRTVTLESGTRHHVGSQSIKALSNSGSIENLRSITLDYAHQDCLLAFSRDREWEGLRHLTVGRWDRDDDAPDADEQLIELFNAKHLRGLKSLELNRIQFESNEAFKAISDAHLPELRSLLFRCERSGLGSAVARAKHMRKLRVFTVENSFLKGSEIANVICSANLPNLAVLNLPENGFNGFSKNIFRTTRGKALRQLAISGDRVTIRWEPLFRWLAQSSVASFALGGSAVQPKPDAGAMNALMKCGEFPNLRRIEMRKEMLSATLKKHFGPRLREWSRY